MVEVLVAPHYGEHDLAAELTALDSKGLLAPPPDPDSAGGPMEVPETDWLDTDSYQLSRVDALEWQLWAGADQDAAERALLAERAPAWVGLQPGGELASALELVRPQTESPVALIEVMKAAARMTAWAESIKIAAMASFYRQREAQAVDIPRPGDIDSTGRPTDPMRSAEAEIAAALHLSPTTAYSHIQNALRLTSTLTATHTALRCGAITLSKALAIADATSHLTPQAQGTVETRVLPRAPGQSNANLRASLRRAVAAVDARREADRHRDARRERQCRYVPLPDGMAGLWITNTADKIKALYIVMQALADLAKRSPANHEPSGAVPADGLANSRDASTPAPTPAPCTRPDATDATHSGTDSSTEFAGSDSGSRPETSTTASGHHAARPQGQTAATSDAHGSPGRSGNDAGDRVQRSRPKDQRTAEQRRSDVVVDLFEHILHNGVDWLDRRLPDQHRRRPHIEVTIAHTTLLGLDDLPGELIGYGPIPADLARRIAADGTWRRLLTDPTNGTVLEAATTRHDPGLIVSETLLARHPTCDWTNCNRPARECDRDHGQPFTHTGRTVTADLRVYCEYHHIIKDTPAWGWKATNNPDGSTTLTTPTGHRYTTVPPARGHLAVPRSTAPTPPRPSSSPSPSPATATATATATAEPPSWDAGADPPPF